MLLFFFLILVFLHNIPLVQSAHSHKRGGGGARRSSSPQYDREVTTFDPNGRLLQVEYAQAAANRGESVMAVVHDNAVYVLLVNKGNNHKIHVLDESLWMIASGWAADSLFLADLLRQEASESIVRFGEPMRTRQAAQLAGVLQHSATLLPGYRPLGIVALLIGTSDGESFLYRCGPGGVVHNCQFCTAGAMADVLLNTLSRKREWTDSAETVVETMLQVMREVIPFKRRRQQLLDLWVFRPDGIVQCYESIGDDRTSRMNLKALLASHNKE